MAQTNVQAFSGDVEVADSLTATNLIRGVVEEAVRWNSQNEGVFPQSASTRYYKIATLGTTSDASNGGKLRISGIIGGFSENETTLIDAFVASRGGIRYGGTLTGYGGDTSDVDIVVYLESGGTFSVWIKVIRFFTFDFTIMGGQVSNNARRLTVLSCPTTDTSVTTPTGTLQGSVVDSCSVVFTDDGNVGIGTDNPTSKLEVGDGSGSASGNAPGSITVNGTGATKSTGGKPGLYHRANVGLGLWSDVAMTMQVNGSSGTPLEAMRILNSGNVGIGTAIPKDVLHIFKASTNQTSGLFIEKANSSSGTAQITFGTANVNEGSTGKAKAAIFFERTATNGRGELHFCVDSSDDNNGVALSDVRMVITNAGNVGIGTDSPTDLLDVHYPTPSYGSSASNEEGSLTVSAGAEHSNAAVYFRTPFDAAAPAKMAIFSSGGGYSGASTGGLHLCVENTSNNTTKVSLNNSRMVIKGNGHVGIGSTAPFTTLDVSGSIHARHSLCLGYGSGTAAYALSQKKALGLSSADAVFTFNLKGVCNWRPGLISIKVATVNGNSGQPETWGFTSSFRMSYCSGTHSLDLLTVIDGSNPGSNYFAQSINGSTGVWTITAKRNSRDHITAVCEVTHHNGITL